MIKVDMSEQFRRTKSLVTQIRRKIEKSAKNLVSLYSMVSMIVWAYLIVLIICLIIIAMRDKIK